MPHDQPFVVATNIIDPLNQGSPVGVLSSEQGENIVSANESKLVNINNSIQPRTITVEKGETLGGIAQREGVGIGDITGFRSGDPNLIFPGEVLTISGSSASNKMRDDINAVVTQGGLTTDERVELNRLRATEDEVTSAAAKAKAAQDAGNFRDMDFLTKRAEDARKRLEDERADFFKRIAPLRERLTAALTPGEREQDLRRNLQSIRSQAEQFNLQTQQDKLAEFQGQTLGFARGRAAELEFKASFKRQELALQEKNILAELGLEIELRQMEGLSAEQQIEFFEQDFDLRQKIQDKLDTIEEDLFDKAQDITTEARNQLGTMLDLMEGINPDEMSPETLKQLEDLAERVGIPIDLLRAALKTQHQRLVFDQQLELAREARLAEGKPDPTKTESFITARDFIASNPDASREELFSELLSRSDDLDLNITEINAILDEAGITKEKFNIEGRESEIAIALVKSEGFRGNVEDAKDALRANPVINVNGKDVVFSNRQVEAIIAEIDKQFPGGRRTIIQSLLPGGK